MSTSDLIALLASICSILVFSATLVAKLIQNHMNKIMSSLVKDYLSELKPNHGSSLRDAVNSIREDVTSVKLDLATLEGKFDQHIKENI